MTQRKKICIVTGTRAEYGLLSGLMRELQQAQDFDLQVLACAAHLSEQHGMTVNQILADGFRVDARVAMLDAGQDTTVEVARSVGRGVQGMAEAFDVLQPDLVFVLGDRYEILAAAQAALLMHIPLAHIHGGELTHGAVDDAIRHAISKMANLHFVAAEPYRQRLIQMGEAPDSVFNVGAPGLDVIQNTSLLSEEVLSHMLDFKLTHPLLLVTYHPVTWGSQAGIDAVENVFSALEKFDDACIVWTAPNADPQGVELYRKIEAWVARGSVKAKLFTSLGTQGYLSCLSAADAVIGNSSSGIIEAPTIGTPTVNIGTRQDGRLRARSVIDCDESFESIVSALNKALSESMKQCAAEKHSVYGKGDTAKAILAILRETDWSLLKNKMFYDFPLL